MVNILTEHAVAELRKLHQAESFRKIPGLPRAQGDQNELGKSLEGCNATLKTRTSCTAKPSRQVPHRELQTKPSSLRHIAICVCR